MPSFGAGKDGKLALLCAACGCHRNFHQCMVLCDGEDQELIKTKRDKENESGNYYTTNCDIDRIANELIATSNGAIALAQQSLYYNEGRAPEFWTEEQNIVAKISLENLHHITKVVYISHLCLLRHKRLLKSSASISQCQPPCH